MSWIDPITFECYENAADAFVIGIHRYHKSTMQILIQMANLGIEIENASEEEFVTTALHDRLYAANDNANNAANPLRFRNPTTNLSFTEPELRYIWRQYFKLFTKEL